MLVGLGNLSVSRKTRRSVLPVAYGLVRNSLEGIVVADCGNQRDNEKKSSADTEQQDLCLVHNYLPI